MCLLPWENKRPQLPSLLILFGDIIFIPFSPLSVSVFFSSSISFPSHFFFFAFFSAVPFSSLTMHLRRYCWISFLTHTIKNEGHDNNPHVTIDDEDLEPRKDLIDEQFFAAFKGVCTVTCKNAVKLSSMDTFSGLADPYLVLSVDGMSQQTKVKTATLQPIWNTKMQVFCWL